MVNFPDFIYIYSFGCQENGPNGFLYPFSCNFLVFSNGLPLFKVWPARRRTSSLASVITFFLTSQAFPCNSFTLPTSGTACPWQLRNIYICPTYCVPTRRPYFVFAAQLRTKAPADKWVLAGAGTGRFEKAMTLCQR